MSRDSWNVADDGAYHMVDCSEERIHLRINLIHYGS
jgi:hypothetical protein